MNKKRKIKKEAIIFLILIIALVVFSYFLFNWKTSDYKDDVTEDKTNIEDKKEVKENKKKTMSIVMVGDVLIHESVYLDAKNSNNSYDFSKMFTDIEPIIKKYDLKYCNQESIIGGKELGISGYPNFNAPEEIGQNLVDMGFNMVSLANNHAYDKGEKAILHSISFWNNYDNVITSGSYDSFESRNNIEIYETNGIKYVFLSYTTGINGYHSNGKDYLVNLYNEDVVKKDIESVRNNADVVIVAMHWGNEYTNEPTKSQREIAKYLADLGVDLIIGTHPHVVQPIEYIDDTLVVYSLGNFISNQLVIGLNPAIGLLLGLEIIVDDGDVTFNIKEKELIYSYSNNSKNFKVIPFNKLSDDILLNYKEIEKQYLNIVDGNI